MARGLMSLLGHPPSGGERVPGGETGDRKVGKTFARYDGADVPPTKYFARGGQAGGHSAAGAHGAYFAKGGMADPEDHEPEVTPELKLAAYELLECLDSSRFSGPDGGKGGRAEAFAKHMLAFVRLADEMPHEEGEHEEEDGEDAEDYGDDGYDGE